jgi:hypothetical protein
MFRNAIQKTIKAIIFNLQKILLIYFYFVFRIFLNNKRPTLDWSIGVNEVAALVQNISQGLGNTVTVTFSLHPFYSYSYDYMLPAKIRLRFLRYVVRIIYGPILLAYLCQRVKGFLYVGGTAYLISELDGREWEFRFLKAKGLKVACFFVGSEIRSYKLMAELSKNLNRDVITTYQTITAPGFDDDDSEDSRYQLAASADKYANHIFNATVDQISYLKKEVHPFMYFYPNQNFCQNEHKFEKITRIRIIHAPSSPLIKGTPLVRAAIKKLQIEGYEFEYIELIRVSHSEILKQLSQAHIVLNEFYAFMPGVFGVEAMASHCALMTSADEKIETSLPKGANSAWMVTEYWNIYDNLKRLLDDHSLIKQYADAGFIWAYEYCSYQNSAAKMRNILNS